MAIIKKYIFKQTIERAEEKIEILAIFHNYKDNLEDLVDSSDIECLNMLGPVDKR